MAGLTPSSTGRSASEASQHVILPLAARTATPSPSTYYFENTGNASGFRLYVNTTAGATLLTHIYVALYDYKTNTGFDQLDYTVTAPGKQLIEISPYVGYVANTSIVRKVGRGVRVTFWHENANSHTYSVTAEWLP